MQTRIDEIADSIYRISTSIPAGPDVPPGGFTVNQFLILDDEPLLFHTGMRRLFPLVRDAIARVMPIDRLRWISFGHHESDEDGALVEWLAAAPQAAPVCGQIGAFYSVTDTTDRAPRVLADGDALEIGKRRVQWIDTPHVPHGWDAGLMFEQTTRTLFCGDLLTQPGADHVPITESDLVGPSQQMLAFGYVANPTTAVATIGRLSALEPAVLAAMHGSAFRGNGAAALRDFATAIESAR